MLNSARPRTGAAFIQENECGNPRELVTSLYRRAPNATRERLFEEFQAAKAGDAKAQRAIDWYFFINMYEYVATSRSRRDRLSPEARAAATQRLKSRVVGVVLLDLIIPPGGKLLRSATFAECAAAGGWFAKVAKQGRPHQVVGKVLTEKQLRAIHA